VAVEPVDLRKGIDGLAALLESEIRGEMGDRQGQWTSG
jgi:hypothetical protein